MKQKKCWIHLAYELYFWCIEYSMINKHFRKVHFSVLDDSPNILCIYDTFFITWRNCSNCFLNTSKKTPSIFLCFFLVPIAQNRANDALCALNRRFWFVIIHKLEVIDSCSIWFGIHNILRQACSHKPLKHHSILHLTRTFLHLLPWIIVTLIMK